MSAVPETAAPTNVHATKRARATERKKRRRTLAEDAVNIPNLLTMARVVMIPLCLWFLERGTPRDCFWATMVFTLAAITDALDGYLARKLNVVSVLGKFLDPLADKLIVMATLVWMVPMGRISAWVVVVLLARELAVTGLRSIASSEGVVIAAGQEGKTKTALQMAGIVALLVGFPYRFHFGPVDLGVVDTVHVGRALMYLSLVFSIASAAQYTRLFGAAVEAKDKKIREASTRDLGEFTDDSGENDDEDEDANDEADEGRDEKA